MSTYTKAQLATLAAGSFKCSPAMERLYGASNGTFLNQEQYNKLDDKDKDKYIKFDNPALAEADPEVEAEKAAKAEAKLQARAAEAAAKLAAAQAKKQADADKAAAKAAKK